MKTFLVLVLISLVSFLSTAEEQKGRDYPKDYPWKSYSSFVAKYGEPGSTEIGTGGQPRPVIHFSTNPVNGPGTIHPTLPPNLADSDKVMYCFWPSARKEEECVWFRQVKGEWVSFWNSAQGNRIFCGVSASF